MTSAARQHLPTMEDVAARAQVSRALVSIVLRRAPGASDATRARVLAAAAEIGYRPDHRARLLGRHRTHLLGVVFGVHHPFHGDLVEALYRSAEPVGYDIALSAVAPSRPEGQAVESLLDYRCEALLLVGPQLASRRIAGYAERMPVTVLARRVLAPGVVSVRSDDVAGARLAVEHLIELGHQRIAHIDGGRAPGAADRRRGYRTAMSRSGLQRHEHVQTGGLTEEDGAAAVAALLSSNVQPSAVTVFNDRSAVGALEALREAGRRVPEDVSIVGFDDDHLARLPFIGLTTVRQDAASLAHQAITATVTRLDDTDADSRADWPSTSSGQADRVIAPTFVQRSTTTAPRDTPTRRTDEVP